MFAQVVLLFGPIETVVVLFGCVEPIHLDTIAAKSDLSLVDSASNAMIQIITLWKKYEEYYWQTGIASNFEHHERHRINISQNEVIILQQYQINNYTYQDFSFDFHIFNIYILRFNFRERWIS